MSLIDVAKGIVSIPGTLIREVGDAILPKQLHWAVDAAAMAVDFETGNYTGVASDALAMLDDVQDAGLGLEGLKSKLPPELIDTLEQLAQPDPPGTADVDAETAPDDTDDTDAADTTSGAGGSHGSAATTDDGSTTAESTDVTAPKASKPKSSTTKPKSASKPKSTATPKSASKPKTAAKPKIASAPKSTAKPKTAAAPKAGSSTKAADIGKLSDDDLLKMVADGTIPADIMKDDKAMMALQMRVQQIQEMNTLLTNMLRDLHDMKMDIIRNTRA